MSQSGSSLLSNRFMVKESGGHEVMEEDADLKLLEQRKLEAISGGSKLLRLLKSMRRPTGR